MRSIYEPTNQLIKFITSMKAGYHPKGVFWDTGTQNQQPELGTDGM